jgi:hypothetical protein
MSGSPPPTLRVSPESPLGNGVPSPSAPRSGEPRSQLTGDALVSSPRRGPRLPDMLPAPARPQATCAGTATAHPTGHQGLVPVTRGCERISSAAG